MITYNPSDCPSGKVPMLTIKAFCPYRGNVKLVIAFYSFTDNSRVEKRIKNSIKNKIIRSVEWGLIDDIPY